MESDNSKKYLVLSGGSVRGISHLGALQKLIDLGKLDLKKMQAMAGSSVGAFICTLLACGFTVSEIWEFVQNIDLSKLVDPSILQMTILYGMDSGDKIYCLLQEILQKKTGIEKISFKQLFEHTHIRLVITGSCLTNKEICYYDHIMYPDFEVALAVRISISMPLFFTPVIIDQLTYVDGAILDPYPIKLFDDYLEETIGILITDNYKMNYTYFEEYLLSILNLFLYKNYHDIHTNQKYRKCSIIVEQPLDEMLLFNFNLDSKSKLMLYERGIDAASAFLSNNLT